MKGVSESKKAIGTASSRLIHEGSASQSFTSCPTKPVKTCSSTKEERNRVFKRRIQQ